MTKIRKRAARRSRRGRRKQRTQTEQKPVRQEDDQEAVRANDRPGRAVDEEQRLRDIEAHQNALGNKATMDRLERETAQERRQVSFNGATYQLTPEEYQAAQAGLAQKLQSAVDLIRRSAILMKEEHQRFERYHDLVGGVSDFLKANLPPVTMWNTAEPFLRAAEANLERGRLDAATALIRAAEANHNEAERTWREYQRATGHKTPATEAGLQIAHGPGFAAAEALAGAGTTPAEPATGDGSAASERFLRAVRDAAVQPAQPARPAQPAGRSRSGREQRGRREQRDPRRLVTRGDEAKITDFVEAMVSGPLAQKFYSGVLEGLADEPLRLIAAELSLETGQPVTVTDVRWMFEGSGSGLLAEFFAGGEGRAATQVLTEVMAVVFQGVDKGEINAPEQFVDKFVEAFLESQAAALFVMYARRRLPRGV